MTGYYPHRLGLQRSGVGRYHPYGLDARYKILPEYLKTAGYRTHLIGKWHLGYCRPEYLPNNRGFDSFFGQWSHVTNYYTRLTPVSKKNKRKNKKSENDKKWHNFKLKQINNYILTLLSRRNDFGTEARI